MNIYNHLLMDHYKNPRYASGVENANFTSGSYNPSCGDRIEFEGRIENNTLIAIGFRGVGCIISQATASILAERVMHKTVDYIASLQGSQLEEWLEISLGPLRSKCALLPLQALQKGVRRYQL